MKKKLTFTRAIELLHHVGSRLTKMHTTNGHRWIILHKDGGEVSEKDALAIIARRDIVVRDRGLLDDCPQSWCILQQGAR
jgi:hypothetical protein